MDTRLYEFFKKISAQQKTYTIELFDLVYAGVISAQDLFANVRHVGAKEVCASIKELIYKKYGCMSRTVLEHYGAKDTMDFGKVIYLLIEGGMLASSPDDKLSDFEKTFDFLELEMIQLPKKLDLSL